MSRIFSLRRSKLTVLEIGQDPHAASLTSTQNPLPVQKKNKVKDSRETKFKHGSTNHIDLKKTKENIWVRVRGELKQLRAQMKHIKAITGRQVVGGGVFKNLQIKQDMTQTIGSTRNTNPKIDSKSWFSQHENHKCVFDRQHDPDVGENMDWMVWQQGHHDGFKI